MITRIVGRSAHVIEGERRLNEYLRKRLANGDGHRLLIRALPATGHSAEAL